MSYHNAFSAPPGSAVSSKKGKGVSSLCADDNMPPHTNRTVDLSTLCSEFVYPPLLPYKASTPKSHTRSSPQGYASSNGMYPGPLSFSYNKAPLSFDDLGSSPSDLSLVPSQLSQYDISCMTAAMEGSKTPMNKTRGNAAAYRPVSAQTVATVEEDVEMRTPRASARLAGHKHTERFGGSTEKFGVFACRRAPCGKTFTLKGSRDRHERTHDGNMHFCPNPRCWTNSNKTKPGLSSSSALQGHLMTLISLHGEDNACVRAAKALGWTGDDDGTKEYFWGDRAPQE